MSSLVIVTSEDQPKVKELTEMAVVQMSIAPSRGDYEQVAEFVDLAGNRPQGLIMHAACDLSNGEVQLLSVWDSEESLAHFSQARVLPAFEQAGVLDKVMARPRPVHYE